MAKSSITDSKKKKLQLEEELKQIQKGIDESLDDVKYVASESLGPKRIIRKYPLPVVGAAIILGMIVGRPARKSSKSTQTYSKKNSGSVTDLLMQELKRIAVKRGVSLINDKIDEAIGSRLFDNSE